MAPDPEVKTPTRTKSAGAAVASSELKALGKYQIQKKLGAGGMGAVYLAKDQQLNRFVALKVLPKDKAENPTLVRRFKAEAQSAAQLRHENIVTVYESGEADGHLYIAMEFVDGIDVHEFVARRGVLPVKRSIEIVKQVTKALEHAHARNIVHRDIKPSNLLIHRDGCVKLTDLGLARSIDDTIETNITRAGTTVGTVDYMAPEQARNSKAADIRSDIYSLGCTWYQMLTGEPPFPEGSLTNKLQAHATKPPPDPRSKNPAVTEGVIAVLNRMLAKKPEDRYQTPGELLEDLEEGVLERDAISAQVLAALADEDDAPRKPRPTAESHKPPPPPPRMKVKEDEQPRAAVNLEWVRSLIAVVVLLAVLLGLGWLIKQFSNEVDAPIRVNTQDPNLLPDPAAPTMGAVAPGQTAKDGSTADNPATVTEAPPDPSQAKTPGELRNAAEAAASQTAKSPSRSGNNQSPVVQPPKPREPRHFEPFRTPAWADAEFIATGLKRVTVGPGTETSTHFGMLAKALSSLPRTGGIVELIGSGTYALPPVQLDGVANILITAQPKERPVINLIAGATGKSDAVLRVSNGSLQLQGVNLAVDATQFPSNDRLTLISVTSGDLWARRCSVTLLGQRPGATCAFAASGSSRDAERMPPQATRILLDRTMIRGNRLIGLEIAQPATDVLIRNSLIAVSDGPALQMSGTASAAAHSALWDGPARVLRVFGSTLYSTRIGLELTAASEPPETTIVARESLFTTGPRNEPSVLLLTHGWPMNPARKNRPASYADLDWMMQSCLVLGWHELLASDDKAVPAVTDARGWQRVSSRPADAAQFRPEPFPSRVFADLSTATPDDFHSAGTGVRDVLAADGLPPGVRPNLLPVPDLASQERLAAMSHRPKLPATLVKSPEPKHTLRVDLTREDLGVVLTKTNWPSGTQVIASGAGTRSVSPFRIENKSLQIRFVQTEGKPLQLLPKAVESSRSGEKEAPALITVDGGELDMADAVFVCPPTQRQHVPAALLLIRDGSFVLRHCTLQGPMLETPGHECVIRWQRTAAKPSATVAAKTQYGFLKDCYLTGTESLVKADMRNRGLVLQNCLLVARGDAIELQPQSVDGRITAAVELDHCTLSATRTDIRVHAAEPSGPIESRLRLFIENTVFAPPFVTRADDALKPAVLAYTGSALADRQFEWWGKANGVAPEVAQLLRGDGNAAGPSVTGDPEAWQNAIGAGHELRLLTGPDGAILQNDLPRTYSQLSPASFTLHRTARALRWDDKGGPIGAQPSALEFAPPPKPADEPTPKTKTNPARPGF